MKVCTFLVLLLLHVLSKHNLNAFGQYPEDYAGSIRNNAKIDFIIIGAGSAGCVVANRLSANPNWSVLLLEAGGDPTFQSTIPGIFLTIPRGGMDWNYNSVPNDFCCQGFVGNACHVPRGKVLGGCSAINAMMWVEGFQQDYDEWASLGNTGWDYSSVKPYFQKVEGQMKRSIVAQYPIHMRAKLRQAGAELNMLDDPDLLGSAPITTLGMHNINTTIWDGKRFSSADGYLSPIKDRSNLKLVKRAFVTKIIFKGNQAVGVQANIRGEMYTFWANREVVLSAGAINSPKILMLSGVGPMDQLNRFNLNPVLDNPNVGANMQDHAIHYGLIINVNVNEDFNIPKILFDYFIAGHTGTLSGIELMDTDIVVNTHYNSTYPNIQVHNTYFIKHDFIILPFLLESIGVNLISAFSILAENQKSSFYYPFVTLLHPTSRGSVNLSSSDPYAPPLIHENFLQNFEDVEEMLTGIDLIMKIMNTNALSGSTLVDFDIPNCRDKVFASREYWICSLYNLVSTTHHQSGTCKMGLKNDAAVIDPQMRIYGLRGISVVDASAMPKVVSGNTNIPVIMMAEKGADMIIQRHT